jgi:hypothetical protein
MAIEGSGGQGEPLARFAITIRREEPHEPRNPEDVPALLLALAPAAEATTIDFNDGSSGVPVDSAYVAQGIVFSNAAWATTGLDGTSPPIALVSLNMPFGSVIPDTAAIVAEIFPEVDEVQVTAVDVGLAGARLEAYDEYPGGAAHCKR